SCTKFHATFDQILRCWIERGSTVITFNYDTLIEKRATQLLSSETNKVSANDLYIGPFTNIGLRTHSLLSADKVDKIFRLIKLHGSTNWFYSGNEHFAGEQIYVDPLYMSDN